MEESEKRIVRDLEKCIGCNTQTNKQYIYQGKWYPACQPDCLAPLVLASLRGVAYGS